MMAVNYLSLRTCCTMHCKDCIGLLIFKFCLASTKRAMHAYQRQMESNESTHLTPFAFDIRCTPLFAHKAHVRQRPP